MNRFKFWKRSVPEIKSVTAPPSVSRFSVTPRQDVGTQGLPADPELAAKVTRLRRRRESILHEVESAIEASNETNRWRSEIALIDQAMTEIDGDIAELPARSGPAGATPPSKPITIVRFEQEPVVKLELGIDDQIFMLSEDLDWAERGHQLARSDLHIEDGDITRLTEDPALQDHLVASLLVYGTDVRDRLIEGEYAPVATIADLARPSEEFGGWLDWAGHSLFEQQRNLRLNAMRAERDRLEHERDVLIAEEAKAAESLPFAQRRLAEVDAELAALTQT